MPCACLARLFRILCPHIRRTPSYISAVDEEEEVEGDGTTIVCALGVELREINDGKYRYLTSYTCISGIHMYRDSNPCTSEF